MTKLKHSYCDKTKNSNCEKNLKSQIVTKHKNLSCEKSKLKL